MEQTKSGNSLVNLVTTTIYNFMVLNALWILGSLLIVTIGASTTAIYSCIGKLFRKELGSVTGEFFESYKKNFVVSTKVWTVLLAGFVMSFITIWNGQMVPGFMLMIQVPIIVQLILISLHVFIIISRFDVGFKKALKVGLVIGNKNIIPSVGSLAMIYLLLKLGLRVPAILLFFFFSLSFTLISFFSLNTISKLEDMQTGEM